MQSELKKIAHPARESQEVTDRLSALGTHDLFNLGTISHVEFLVHFCLVVYYLMGGKTLQCHLFIFKYQHILEILLNIIKHWTFDYTNVFPFGVLLINL